MKKTMFMVIGAGLLLAACNTTDAESEARQDLPLEWATAIVQQDGEKMDELLLEEETTEDNQGPQNNYEIEEYEIVEYKYDDETYFYEIYYYSPRDERMRTNYVEAVYDEGEWKKRSRRDKNRFNELKSRLEGPETIKELNE